MPADTAPLGARAAAWVVDAIPHALVPYAVARAGGSVVAGIGAFVITGIVWSMLPEGLLGWSPGKRVLGMWLRDGRSPDTPDGRIGLLRAAVRWLVKYPVSGVLPVFYLWCLRDPSRLAVHDLAAGTVVVTARPG